MNKNLIDLVEGDKDPICGDVIRTLVYKDVHFIVYLTDDSNINWATEGYTNFAPDFGLITNRVKSLEHVTKNLYSNHRLEDMNYLLAEALARCLDDHNTILAKDMLDDIETRIATSGNQILKIKYLLSSVKSTVLIIVFLIMCWILREFITPVITESGFTILLASLCGGIGAFLSSFIRSINFKGDVHIEMYVYKIDGALRIFYGVIAAFIIALAIKSNFILGMLNQLNYSVALLCFCGCAAGASETLVPSIIQKLEGSINTKNRQ